MFQGWRREWEEVKKLKGRKRTAQVGGCVQDRMRGVMGAFRCRGPQPSMALALGWVALLALVGSGNGSVACGAATGGVGGRASTLGLRGGRELEQETRRKPFDENVEAADVILKDWKKKGAHAPSALESLLAETLLKQASVDRSVGVASQDVFAQCKYEKHPKAG